MKKQVIHQKRNIQQRSTYSKKKTLHKKRETPLKSQTLFAKISLPPQFIIGWILLIAIATIFSYKPAFNNGITNFDDNLYITDSPYLQSLESDNVKAIFSSYYMGNYHPLSMLSLAINYKNSEKRLYVYTVISKTELPY